MEPFSKKRNDKRAAFIRCAFLTAIMACFFSISALAIDTEGTVGGTAWNLTEFAAAVQKLSDIFRSIALPLGAVGIAWCGITMLINGKDAEKGFTYIKYILIAEAVIFFIPVLIKFGAGLLGSSWDPANPSSGIITWN